MYNCTQQNPGQYYQMPERQDTMYPDYPETYRPLVPGYPSNGRQQVPLYPTVPLSPTTPAYPDYPEAGYPETGYPQTGYPQTGYPQTGYPQTGYPATPPYGPQGPLGMQPIVMPDVGFEEGPPTLTDQGYTPAYLRTQIGRNVKIEFLIGTNMLVDREGRLVNVGINYVIIQEAETDDLLLCDLYSIKFVRFYY